MKTITHPSPHYTPYNRILQYLSLPICLSSSIENLCITALMISYSTPNIIDSFIWILPNIISILIRPSLISYIHRTFSPRHMQLVLITYFLFIGSIGSAIVAVSALWIQDQDGAGVLRILVCTLGWVMADVSFQMVEFFGSKTKDRLAGLGYVQQEGGMIETVGEILGYAIGFGICLYKGGKTMRKFHNCCGYIYLASSSISLTYSILLSQSSHDTLTLHPQLNPQSSLQLPTLSSQNKIQYYLPGYYEFKSSYGYDRWLMCLYFSYLYIVDALLIYGTMWIAMVYDNIGEKEGVAYNLGLREGALVLAVGVVFGKVDIGGLVLRMLKIGDRVKIRIFVGFMLVICGTSLMLFNYTHHQTIFILSILIGTLQGLFQSTLQPILQKNTIYESTQQLISRIQKLFILCPMPFIIMIILNRDDISDVLLTIPIIVIIVLIIGLIYREKSQEDKQKGSWGGGKVKEVDKDL